MAPFEYMLGFAVVILGLSVTELAMGLNRLLRTGKVRWDWLAPFAALLVFLKIVAQWWSWHAAVRFAPGMTFEMYLAVLASATLLFLLAATPLPEVREGGTDLRAYYAGAARRFWILFALHSASAIVTVLWVQLAAAGEHAQFQFSIILLLPLIALGFAFARPRWAQALGLALFTALYIGQYFGRTLF
ncbi:hypothetical protein OF829_09800 [Sphingomonas sp. LB-2]|uniref:hypothetical protein n=1 Tax=Sphingomonas caeni TaxID=2984949 RepID=UPI00222E8893|nr:hypothetical protein [Sphingomonas caeni]MCW3847535.1 hypothetical protein [Sphingomonas caeni]